MRKGLRIKGKITILSFCIVLFAFSIGGIILTGHIALLKEDELGQRLLVTARTVAEMPAVAEGLTDKDKRPALHNIAERIRIVNNTDYIVIMDMNGIRWTHPANRLIGTKSGGADERAAFAEHTYLSKAKGEEGTALRAFAPVMNEEREQVGVVLAGKLLPTLGVLIQSMLGEIYVISLLTLLFGIWGSWLLASHIKKRMFELEPEEIARLLVERTATFQAMHEGIVAIDSEEKITIFNDKAKEMLRVQGDVIGRPVREILPDSRLPATLRANRPLYNHTDFIGPAQIVSTRVPITVKDRVVGAVSIFQDRTEVTRMAEELTGVKAFVEALRVQSHEYMNKLHTVGGLIQLGDERRALAYLYEVVEQQEGLLRFVNQRVRVDSIAGLLLGKISRGKELGIEVRLDSRSWLEELPAALDHHDMVVVLGNLVENAFDALQDKQGIREVFLSVEQNAEVCSVLIEDNGHGMSQETLARLFEMGYTTKKSEHRGIGMHLVYSIVDGAGGTIAIDSDEGEGTSIMITLPMQREEGNDGESRADESRPD
ncbi:sensor histidine kinase [Paenibacillus jiagnxiensis]|uniref:sensor histidine kinase n=1 Tax=Paenibacillus jiagnxiensis TaxID=3228926 RepID=UPI0033B8570B